MYIQHIYKLIISIIISIWYNNRNLNMVTTLFSWILWGLTMVPVYPIHFSQPSHGGKQNTSYLVAILLNCCLLSSRASCSRQILSDADLWREWTLQYSHNKHLWYCMTVRWTGCCNLGENDFIIYNHVFSQNSHYLCTCTLENSSYVQWLKNNFVGCAVLCQSS